MNDEKKKLIVLLALVAVVGCIGAFQLLKKGGAPPPPPPATAGATDPATASAQSADGGKGYPDAKAATAKPKTPVIKNPLVANDLPSRDPFQLPMDQRPKLTPQTPPMATKPAPFPHLGNHFSPTVPPLGLPGKFSPDITPLPGGNPGMMGRPTPPPVKTFDYKVVGAISGDRPAVVLQDANGNQKLVPEGAAVDGEFRVRRVEKGAVVIESRNKKFRLTVGGTSVDKN